LLGIFLIHKKGGIVLNVFANIRKDVLSLFDNSGWVKWIHEGYEQPAYTKEEKKLNVNTASVDHCAKCINLNGCCFPTNNRPEYPLHPNCHCKVEPVSNLSFEAESSIDKFQKFIFDPVKNKGKKELFESWGYDIIDSQWLQEEYCRQAQEKYAKGKFTLNLLDEFGQRINIEISLPRKNGKGEVTFMSGWMVYPDGKIQLVTPYGDK